MSRVVIASDSFKGSIAAADASSAIADGWASVRRDDELVLLPMADGGEGTVDAFATAVPGSIRETSAVTGPDDREVTAEWLRLPDGTAVIELAAASGLHLLDPLRPLDAHTLGFGQLVASALAAGASRLVLAIGGSATTDGGAGLLTALGARLLDADGRPVRAGNRGLAVLERVDLDGLAVIPPGSVALSDVTNPLLGPSGAARVFGPQKGASPAEAVAMDANLDRLVSILGAGELALAPGSGAAGGTGFALLLAGIPLEPGARSIGELIGIPTAAASADLVITGEGRFDSQSASGKVVDYVSTVATAARTPVALVAGSIEAPTGSFRSTASLSDLAGSASEAMSNPRAWLVVAGRALATSFIP